MRDVILITYRLGGMSKLFFWKINVIVTLRAWILLAIKNLILIHYLYTPTLTVSINCLLWDIATVVWSVKRGIFTRL